MGLGGIYKTQKSLTSYQNSMTMAAARSQQDAAIRQSELEAGFQQRQIDVAAGQQAQQYASSGVLLQGTPLAMINSTRELGAMQVRAIRDAGSNQADLYRAKAFQTRQAGLTSLLAAEGQTSFNTAQMELNQRIQRRQNLMGLLKTGASFGVGLLRII
jgi:hypothetical protein